MASGAAVRTRRRRLNCEWAGGIILVARTGVVNRVQWQQLATRWLADAKTLLDDHRWSAAYYLAGYAVECGLKACVLARVEKTGVIFDDPKYSEKIRTHKLPELLK